MFVVVMIEYTAEHAAAFTGGGGGLWGEWDRAELLGKPFANCDARCGLHSMNMLSNSMNMLSNSMNMLMNALVTQK